MAELLPCPFCGGKVDHYHVEHISFHERKHRFRCNQCNGIFFFYIKGDCKTAKQYEKEGIKLWNIRTPTKLEHNSLCETETYKGGD